MSRRATCAVALGLLAALAACAKKPEPEAAAPPASSETTGARHASVSVALEIDGQKRDALIVTAVPVSLESVLPSGVKPLSAWKYIHAVTESERFVLVSYPGTNHRGQVPMLYLDGRGRAVFAMLEAGPGGALPGSAAEMKKRPVAMQLVDVARLALWVDADPPKAAAPAGEIALQYRNRRVVLGATDLGPLLGEQAVFAGHGATGQGSSAEAAVPAAPPSEPGRGQNRAVGKPAGTPLGWPLAELLRKTVLQGGDLLGIRVSAAQGEPTTIEPKWWTDKTRFLGIRVNRKGEFVVHGYTLGERATLEVEVRGATAVEAISEGGRRQGGGRGEGDGRGDGKGDALDR